MLTFRSAVGVLPVSSLLVPLVARVRAGERLLRSHFRAEYEAYRART
jgi:protein-S-isoprenylcysteine O-methyltransferase Ste14